MDRITPERRSRNMAQIGSRNTTPELIVRNLLHGMGYRFRVHNTSLPGKPDIVFSKRRVVLMIHGCFWHRHPGCRYARMPSSNEAFWSGKFQANVARDDRVKQALMSEGWRVLTVWECETRSDRQALSDSLKEVLGEPKHRSC